jgi:hypothetical protein
LVAVFAASLAITALASAAAPEFTVATKFKAKSGKGVLETVGKSTVKCEKSKGEGETTVGKEVKGVKVTFEECESGGFSCGTIKTETLKGKLVFLGEGGKVTTKVGLNLEPASGTLFAKFTCAGFVNVEVKNKVLGKIEPIGKKTKTYTLTYTQKNGVQTFKEAEFDNNGKLEKGIHLESKIGGGSFEESAEETTATIEAEKEGEIT